MNYRDNNTQNTPVKPEPSIIERCAELMIRSGLKLHHAEDELRKAVIERAMTLEKGNQCKVARLLGIHRNTVCRDIAEFGLRTDHAYWRERYSKSVI
jgi:DNA-binding NtrC family response regulator